MNDHHVREQIRGKAAEEGLLFLHESGGRASQDDFARALGPSPYDAHQVVQELDELGLVKAVDFDLIPLSHQGQRLAQIIVRSRVDGPDRRDAVQRAILERLSEGSGLGTASDFLGDPKAIAFGVPFEVDEIKQAAQFLFDNQLIMGFKSMAGLQRLTITYEGGYALHSSSLIVDFLKRGGSTTYDNSTTNIGNGNTIGAFQTGGRANSQNVTQTVNPATRMSIANKATELLGQLPEPADSKLRKSLEAVRAEATSETVESSSLQALVLAAMASAVGSGLGESFMQELAQLAQMIPGIGG